MTIRKNILIIFVFIGTLLALFINKLTTPRTLSTNELLINGLFLFEQPKAISDFVFYSENNRNLQIRSVGKWTTNVFWIY